MNNNETEIVQDIGFVNQMSCPTITEAGMVCNAPTVSGTKNCARHGGSLARHHNKHANLGRFKKSRWFTELASMEDNQLKDLLGEVAVLKLLQQNVLNACSNEYELLMQTPQLSDLLTKSEKLVNSCHKLQVSMGSLLSQESVFAFAGSVIEAIVKEIESPEVIQRISAGIELSLEKLITDNKEVVDD